ncbi:MAG: hypothetical protein WA755_10385 [Candidatus Acidiferrales bacterium]
MLRKLLQKGRGVAVVGDRGHEVLNLSLELLLALSHLLDFAAQVPECRAQLASELTHRVVDHFRLEQLGLQPAKESFFEMVAPDVKPVSTNAAVEIVRADVLRTAVSSAAGGDDEIPSTLTAPENPAEQIRARDGTRKQAWVPLRFVQAVERREPLPHFVPELNRHDRELGVSDALPFGLRAHFSAALVRSGNFLEFRAVPNHFALVDLTLEHCANGCRTPRWTATGARPRRLDALRI